MPTSLHFDIASNCLKKQVHTLLEKPIADSVVQAQQLVSLSQMHNCILMVGHIERYNPTVTMVKNLLAQNQIGDIITLIVNRCSSQPKRIRDVDVSLDLAIHDVDLSNYLIKGLPTTISTVKQSVQLKDRSDSASFLLGYPNCTAFIHSDWVSRHKVRTLRVLGTKGEIFADLVNRKVQVENGQSSTYTAPDHNALILEITAFVDAILLNKNPDATHAVQALEVVLKETK